MRMIIIIIKDLTPFLPELGQPPPKILQASNQHAVVTIATPGSLPRCYVTHEPLRLQCF